MNFFFALSAFVAIAQAAIQDNTAFTFLVLRSGSSIHFSTVKETSDQKLVIDSSLNTTFTGVFLSDGTIRVGDSDQWLVVGADQQLTVQTGSPQTFEVNDQSVLTLDGSSSSFYVIENEDGTYGIYSGSGSTQTNAFHISLLVDWDRRASSASSSTSTSTSTSSESLSSSSTIVSSSSSHITSTPNITTATSTSSELGQVTETVTICSKNGTCAHPSTSVPQVNGAALAVGTTFWGAAVAAAAGVAGIFIL